MHEIIHIVDPQLSTGEVRHGLEIEAVKDRPLQAGYYFVLWPPAKQKQMRGSNQEKRYFGPFKTCVEARLLQRSALSLGLIEEGMALSHEVAECRSIVRPVVATHHPAAYRDHSVARQNLAASPA